MKYSFLELLISFLLTLEYIFIVWSLFLTTSWYFRNKKKYCMQIQTPIETNHEIKTKIYSFSVVSDTDFEKFYCLCRVKILYQQFLTFLSFMNIFRSSCLEMLFKTGALKNLAIFWIKKNLQHRCFPVNIAKFLRTGFLRNFSGGCFCIILKLIKQIFRESYS